MDALTRPACYLPDERVLAALDSSPETGLTSAEAARRLAVDGPNELRSAPPEPWWRAFLRQFADPLVYLLLVAIAISVVAWVVEGAGGWPIEATVIAAILIANAIIGLVQEAKAADAVAALARMTAATSTVWRDGQLASVHSSELVKGDILVLSEGDAVGADARLLSAAGLKVQEASLTGESESSVKNPDTIEGEVSIGDQHNMVFKGTAVVEGVGRAVVTATGMDTEMGAVAEMLDEAKATLSPLEVQLAKVSKTLGLLVIGVAVIVMGALYFVNGAQTVDDAVTILLTGVSLAVAAVPEGLVAILSLVLAIGVRTLASRNAVLKDLHSVETLGSASVICSDKTGTLTRNEMTLRTIVTASGQVTLSGLGYVPEGSASIQARDVEQLLSEARLVLIGGTVANNAQLSQVDGEWQIQGDPTEAAFLVAQHKLAEVSERVTHYERLGEVPFTSERKLMSVLTFHDQRRDERVFSKGAPDVLLTKCTKRRIGDQIVPLDDASRSEILKVIEELSSEGYRTLGVAYRGLRPHERLDREHPDATVESDLIYVGLVGIIDPPRDEAIEAVALAKRAGVRPIMITGDHPVTARRIGADLGITTTDARVLTGLDLDDLDEQEFAAAVKEVNVFARVAPRHKLQIVEALQADQNIVAMTGDGVNDAPALKTADIGVAMGITGTEVSKDAANMILADDNFATIVTAVRQGRVVFDNISKFLRYLLSSNLGEVTAVFFGVVLGGVLGLVGPDGSAIIPLLATQILWINLVTDSAPALALGVDPEIDDTMQRRPRRRDEQILDAGTWWRITWVGLVMGAATLLVYDVLLPGGLFAGHESVTTARTAAFTTLVLAQLVNVFCTRSVTTSAFHGLASNKWLLGAVALGVVLQVIVVHVPFLQPAFGTTALTPAQWLLCAGVSLVVLVTTEVVKLIRKLPG